MAKPSANCDMCGKQEQLVKALIEGVEMNVCKACASFGKVMRSPQYFSQQKHFSAAKQREPEIVEEILEEYAIKIKQAREKRKLNQEEFAKMLNEKESVLHAIEAGKQKPTFVLAKKLEKMLGITLIVQVKEEVVEQKRNPKGLLTIGDSMMRNPSK